MPDQPIRPTTPWPWIPPGLEALARIQLSTNFQRGEMSCRCGCVFGLQQEDVNPLLVVALQALHDRIGKLIEIVSGCRCADYNRLKKGARLSQHVLGKAADIKVPGMTARELYREASARMVLSPTGHGVFSGFGVSDEDQFVHVDVRRGLDFMVVERWCYTDGKEAPWRDDSYAA